MSLGVGVCVFWTTLPLLWIYSQVESILMGFALTEVKWVICRL
jgi:hypothetical protein